MMVEVVLMRLFRLMILLGFFGFFFIIFDQILDFCKKSPVPAVVGVAEIALGD